MTFKELNLKEEILSAIEVLGYELPMPVQEKVIPFMLEENRDLIALAQTGTGKTAAFGLPILEMTDAESKHVQSLILSPTRELCIQIAKDLEDYAINTPIKTLAVYGGEEIRIQLRKLNQNPQIIVATPGRLIDLIERKRIHLGHVKTLVLDEADEMLNMGFQEDIETILKETPKTRRTTLFSATMPREILHIAKNYMHDYEEIIIGDRNAGADNVSHIYYMAQAKHRYLVLKRIVDYHPDIYGIVFCRTRQETKDVADNLMKDGYNADALHGDLSQAQRDNVMQKFRMRNIQLLVATDVAARGLDVSDLSHIINYNLPDDVEIYTHRSGRTGRAGKKGVAISIIHTRERNKIRNIERMLKKEFEQEMIPNGLEVCKKQLFHLIDKMQHVEVNEEQIEPYTDQITKQLEYLDKDELLKRFVSLEFNRFLDYYKDSEDLNYYQKERSENRNKGNGRKGRRGEKLRLRVNIGQRDGIIPPRLLGIINDVVGDKTIAIGDIEITNKFTFFDVYLDQVDKIVNAFTEQQEIELSIARESKSSSERHGGRTKSRQSKSHTKRRSEASQKRGRRDRSDKPTSHGKRNSRPNSGNSDKPWRNRR